MRFIRTVAAVVRFEVTRSAWVLIASLLCCLGGFAAILLPVFAFLDRDDAWRIAALGFSAPLALLLLTPTLAMTWTSGLRTGLLGFHYARPITAGALWWGRCIASTMLTTMALGTSLLPALPWVTATELSSKGSATPSIGLIAIAYLASLLAVTLLLNALALVLRPRSGYTLAAFVLIIVVATVFWLLHDWLNDLFSTVVYDIGLGTACVGVVGSLLAASWWQVRSGRVDVALAQRAFIISLAISLPISLASPLLSVWWTLHPSPAALDLRWSYLAAPLPSNWVQVSGLLKHRLEDGGIFLVHTLTGRWFRVYSGYVHYAENLHQSIRYAEDGSLAVASIPHTQPGSKPTVQVFDLLNGAHRSLTLPNARGFARPVALLSSGKVLLTGAKGLEILDLRTGEQNCASRVGLPRSLRHSWPIAGELPSGRVAILIDANLRSDECPQSLGEQVVHLEVDTRTCEFQKRPLCAEARMASEALSLDYRTGRALSVTYNPELPAPRRLRIHDLERGTSLDALILGDAPRYPNRTDVAATFLSDDLILATWEESNRARVAVIDQAGMVLGLWTLAERHARAVARFDDDRVLLAVGDHFWGEASLAVFDPFTGNLRSLGGRFRLPGNEPPSVGRLPTSMIAVDEGTGQLVLLSRSEASSPIPLRWHP